MAIVNKVEITLAFEDSTTRKITFNGVEDNALVNVKSKVNTLNANVPASFSQTFVSAIGANCIGISKARIISTEEEVIYGE